MKRFALAGNPNCGKTTLFNSLTGSSAHVGNWPGVTVEKKDGTYKKLEEPISIIDLPGIYSLSPLLCHGGSFSVSLCQRKLDVELYYDFAFAFLIDEKLARYNQIQGIYFA